MDPARLEYQVCLKCHGDSANKPQLTGRRAPGAPARALPEYNLRLVFSPSAASAHPVAAPARAGSPSLKAPLGVGSQIRCTDCHASDDGPGADGSGPRGPHGSVHQFLLERAYSTRDHSVESPAAYALCYKCHDRDVLLSDRSTFPAHQRHVVASGVPCSACHTAHGVAGGSGTAAGNAHLIDFDTAIVQPTASGQRQYTSYGRGAGSCSVSCHGRSHDQTRY